MIKLSAARKRRMRDEVTDILANRLPPLIPMPIPERVRSEAWFHESGAEHVIVKYALPSFRLSTFNGKTPPAFRAWLMDEEAGKFEHRPTVIGGTSGNWGLSAGLIAPLFDVEKFCAVVEPSTPQGKQNHLRASGAEILFAPDGIPPTEYVYDLVHSNPGYHLIDQYVHEGSIRGHEWAMNHIARELGAIGETPSLFGAVTGTCSTLMAADRYLRTGRFPGMKIFGVASMSRLEKVPGSRSPEGLEELKKIGGFPYADVIDFDLVTSVSKREAFELNAAFVQQHFISLGPTGALLEAGSYHLLRQHWDAHGDFTALKNANGKIVIVTFFMDMYLAYLDDPEFLAAFQP